MFLKILLIFIVFLTSINFVKAEENLLTVTPVSKFSSSHKNVYEGDEVLFKVKNETEILKKDDIITGTILRYEPNGFYGQKANVIFGNFKTSNGKAIKGKIYLSGNEHATFQEFSNSSGMVLNGFIRGGEINLKPEIHILEFFTEE